MRRFFLNLRSALLLVLAFGSIRDATSASVAELPPESAAASQYIMRSWHTEDGLPENTITCIAQTSDGYIWFGTFRGLARFDGARFKVLDETNTPKIGSDGIAQLMPDHDGSLWVLRQGGGILRIHGNEVQSFGVPDGLPQNGLGMLRDRGGRIWASAHGEAKTAYSLNKDRLAPVRLDRSFYESFGVCGNSQGIGWIEQGSTVRRCDGSEPKSFPLPAPYSISANSLIVPSRGDGAWYVSEKGILRLTSGQWQVLCTQPPNFTSLFGGCEDMNGNLWIGTWNQGLFFMTSFGKIEKIPLTDSPRPDAIRAFLLDREGNIWIGTDGDGIRRMKRRTFIALDSHSGLSSDNVRSITQDQTGAIWVSTIAGVDKFAMTGGKLAKQLTLPIEVSWSVLSSRHDGLWVATYGAGLHHWFQGNDTLLKAPEAAPRLSPWIKVLFQDSTGELWLGTPEGLYSIVGDHLERKKEPPFGALKGISAIAESSSGTLCIGLADQGILVREHGKWRKIGTAEGLKDTRISSLGAGTNDIVWIGAGSGLCRYKAGQIESFGAAEVGLPRSIACILKDGRGNLWLGSNQGIYRVPIAALNDYADGRRGEIVSMRFGKNDGLASSQCAEGQPSACQSADGRLWFASYRGISVVDPAKVVARARPPEVLIEEARVDGSEVSLAPSPGLPGLPGRAPMYAPVDMAPGAGLLELRYTAIDLTAPEHLVFRYRLEGHDRDWIQAGPERVARYSRLPPGEYTFRVTAASTFGDWNKEGSLLSVIVEPRYFQTLWFKASVIVAGGLIVLAIYRSRQARRRELDRLRVRIASDLHDDLGSNLGSIALKTELLTEREGLDAAHQVELNEINQVALETANQLRDVAWFINPEFDTLGGMILRMQEVAARLLEGREWEINVETAEKERHLRLDFRRNVFFNFKETLHNIAKHSRATRVSILLAQKNGALELVIRDNGCGFDPKIAHTGAGLKNLRRRTSELKGELCINTNPGTGTEVRLVAPI